MPPRSVTIHKFDILKTELPDIHFEVHCSKGTYIRSLANDFGKLLNNGGHLASLRRTAIGTHYLDDAWQLDDLLAKIDAVKPSYLQKIAEEGQ